jgi:Raf kinase inhibitor-like YbhB/YbcL family protein
MSLELKTTAFAYGGEIPAKYTCSGADLSPALNWNGVSRAARSLALIANDPDAPGGTWTHWLIWNIPTILRNFQRECQNRKYLRMAHVRVGTILIASAMAAHAHLPAKRIDTSSNCMLSTLLWT